MIIRSDLRTVARDYLASAAILRRNRKYDAAVYLCGYAVEIALKERICRVLKWEGFPETRKELEGLASFKTHSLEILLRLSGFEQSIITKTPVEWSTVRIWDPEDRYNPRGGKTQTDADDMIKAARSIVKSLLGTK